MEREALVEIPTIFNLISVLCLESFSYFLVITAEDDHCGANKKNISENFVQMLFDENKSGINRLGLD